MIRDETFVFVFQLCGNVHSALRGKCMEGCVDHGLIKVVPVESHAKKFCGSWYNRDSAKGYIYA